MKIYACPKEIPAPQPDYTNYDHAKEQKAEEEHKARLAEWLRSRGYTGKHTGAIYSEQIADGYALYMLADGRTSFLIHLPYGDGYQSRNAGFVPKTEIIRRIEAEKRFHAMFAAHSKQTRQTVEAGG